MCNYFEIIFRFVVSVCTAERWTNYFDEMKVHTELRTAQANDVRKQSSTVDTTKITESRHDVSSVIYRDETWVFGAE